MGSREVARCGREGDLKGILLGPRFESNLDARGDVGGVSESEADSCVVS